MFKYERRLGMEDKYRAINFFESWYKELTVHKQNSGPARGTIGSALVVLERLKVDFDLNLESHRAAGQSQIKGASGVAVKNILKKHGENRPFIKEGGRTNRGGPGDIGKMLEAIRNARLGTLTTIERNEVLENLQKFLVEKVCEYHNRQRLKIIFNPSQSTWQTIYDILSSARDTGKEGPVAQYLVGAKLQLRFPQIQIGNESYSTADDQLGRPGDFHVGDTSFHVTVSPMSAVYEKCKHNIEEGLSVYLLVPDRCLVGARQNAEAIMPGKISVQSIESFVAQNIEELSVFAKDEIKKGFICLLETYNKRVNDTEMDKSMLFEIPRNLLR